jgi:hypothetical protein
MTSGNSANLSLMTKNIILNLQDKENLSLLHEIEVDYYEKSFNQKMRKLYAEVSCHT